MVACHDCDTLQPLPDLDEGESAVCRRCGYVLYKNSIRGLHRSLAFALSAATLTIVAHFFPFLSIRAAGQTNTVSLLESIEVLWMMHNPWLASAVFIFIVGLPSLIIFSQLYVLLPLLRGKVLPGSVWWLRLREVCTPWSMVEIFFLGVLVSLLKLVKLADVSFGPSFWALAALILCLTASLVAFDKRAVWQMVLHERRAAL